VSRNRVFTARRCSQVRQTAQVMQSLCGCMRYLDPCDGPFIEHFSNKQR